MRAPWREQQRFDAAISSLLSNIGHLIVSNRRDAEKRVNEEHAFREKSKNWMSEGWDSMATPDLQDAVNKPTSSYSRHELVRCLLDGSHAIEVAVRYEYKPLFALSAVMNFLEDQCARSCPDLLLSPP